MSPDWISPRLRGPLGIVFCVIAVGLVGVGVYQAFHQRELVSGAFIVAMSGGWAWYGIWFWQNRSAK